MAIFPLQIDHFFAVGSPLPLFLVMREYDSLIKKGHRGAASLLPSFVCRRVHNLHHPSDPIVSGPSAVAGSVVCMYTYMNH